MTKPVTINLSYYNQGEILIKHVIGWLSWPENVLQQFKFCIVDDCSEINALTVIKDMDLSKLDIRIYRVQEDLTCNIAGVRNLAANICDTPWMIILDMDTLVTENLAYDILTLIKSSDNNLHQTDSEIKSECYKFNRMVVNDPDHEKHGMPHPAVCLIKTNDYWRIGGCEEDLVGNYGYTDPCFWHRAKEYVDVITLSDCFLEYDPRGEAIINRNTSHNYQLYLNKVNANKWSDDYIRFKWTQIL